MDISISISHEIRSDLIKNKYALLAGKNFEIAKSLIKDSDGLKASWENLEPDDFLKNSATFRMRRYCLYYFLPNRKELIPFPHTPYFQSENIHLLK